MCVFQFVLRDGPGGGFREHGVLCGKDGEKGRFGQSGCHVNDYLCSVRVVADAARAKNWVMPYVGVAVGGGQSYYGDAQNIANFSLRAGFDVSHFRLFFEQHFNTDKALASFFGLTYYFKRV